MIKTNNINIYQVLMIKTERMNITEELAEGSIVQPQVRLPPPRYPGDLALIYLNHRIDFNLLNYL